MNIEAIRLEIPEGCNLILGMSHFIKTVEDLHEMMINSVPGVKFGVAFSEASGARLVRCSGNDPALEKYAAENTFTLGAGHSFMVIMRDAFPINILPALRNVYEIVNIFCATANPLQVLVVKTEEGNGIVGVVDGQSPMGIEDQSGKEWRHQFLRKIGYKL